MKQAFYKLPKIFSQFTNCLITQIDANIYIIILFHSPFRLRNICVIYFMEMIKLIWSSHFIPPLCEGYRVRMIPMLPPRTRGNSTIRNLRIIYATNQQTILKVLCIYIHIYIYIYLTCINWNYILINLFIIIYVNSVMDSNTIYCT